MKKPSPMKKTSPTKKTKLTQVQLNDHGPATVSVPLAAGQVTTLMRLAADLKDQDETRVAAGVLSIGLFVLGLDRSGDYSLHEITDAIHGKGSDAAVTLFNAIVDAGDGARDEIENEERARRKVVSAKVEEAGA
jgi:hypothetical protein